MYNNTAPEEEKTITEAILESIYNQLNTLERKISIVLLPEMSHTVDSGVKLPDARLKDKIRELEEKLLNIIERIDI